MDVDQSNKRFLGIPDVLGPSRMIAIIAALIVSYAGKARAEDIDALLLGGYWCRSQDSVKFENIPRNRSFLLSKQVEGPGKNDTTAEWLIDVVGDVRGQRTILFQKLKLADGKACKTDCTVAYRIVNKDMLESGDWNSNAAVFKSKSPHEYLYRCEK